MNRMLVMGIVVGIGIGIGIGFAIGWLYEKYTQAASIQCNSNLTALLALYNTNFPRPTTTGFIPTPAQCATVKAAISNFEAVCPDVGAPQYGAMVPPCPP